MNKKVFINAKSISKFGKHEENVLEFSAKTAENCLGNWDRKEIDLLVFSSFCPEIYTKEFHLATKLADKLNLSRNCFCLRTETASSSGASAFHTAVRLLESGAYKNALVVCTEVMSRLPREENNLLLGGVLSHFHNQYQMSMAQGAAMIARRYLNSFGYEDSDLFYIAEKLHYNGSLNPNAHFQKKITREQYDSAPVFSSPLGLYDISPLSDGSVAMLLSVTHNSDYLVRGLGSGTSSFSTIDAPVSFEASCHAFSSAYKEASVSPRDIQIAELHDAFTLFEVIGAEDAGFFPKGKGLQKVKEGVTSIEGDLPINPSGGLKSRGHPIAASGLAQIAEIMRFMEIEELGLGLTHSIGGLATNNFATIIERVS